MGEPMVFCGFSFHQSTATRLETFESFEARLWEGTPRRCGRPGSHSPLGVVVIVVSAMCQHWYKMMRTGSIPSGSLDRQIWGWNTNNPFPLVLMVPHKSPRCLFFEGVLVYSKQTV